MRWLLLAALLAALPLAGCASRTPDAPALHQVDLGVPAAALEENGFYAFRHAGGPLELAIAGNGSADVELYTADDHRFGRLSFGDGEGETASYRLDGLAAGDPVLHVLAVTGELRLRSDGDLVGSFVPLTTTAERIALVSRPPPALEDSLIGGLTGGDAASEDVEVRFERTPSTLRLLASGSYTDLRVAVASDQGEVLVAEGNDGAFVLPPFQSPVLVALDADVHPENFSDGHYQALVTASDLSGALVLESFSYSRARPPGVDGSGRSDDVPKFTFGPLLEQPVSFRVGPGAGLIYLWQEQAGEETVGGGATDGETTSDMAALVALFDPQDRKLATVRVEPNVTFAVPVHDIGDYVAVLLVGRATIGLDDVPADFQLHPLEVASEIVPAQAAGTGGRYAQANATVEPAGVPYAFAFAARAREDFGPAPFPVVAPCSGFGLVRLSQDGETILLGGDLDSSLQDGAMLLQAGGITVTWDDFGDDTCAHPAFEVLGYLRHSTEQAPS